MKNVRKPIRLPNQFREMVITKGLNAAAVVQYHIDLMLFYSFLESQNAASRDNMFNKVRARMMEYQTSGKEWVDERLLNINNFYSKALLNLVNNPKLSDKQKENKSILLLNRWRKVISPLVNYPLEMTIEGSGTVYITFDYFLCSLICNRTIRRHITEYMRYSSEMAAQKRYV